MGLRDHREPERIRHSLAVRLAVDGQREHRLEQLLELERGPDDGDEVQLVVARVPEPMRRPRLDEHGLVGAGLELLPVELHADSPGDDLELLALERVDVRGRDDAARPDEHLDLDRLAARLARGLVEDDALSGDGVLDRVACVNHLVLLRLLTRRTLGR